MTTQQYIAKSKTHALFKKIEKENYGIDSIQINRPGLDMLKLIN
jgi:hypothetical protein